VLALRTSGADAVVRLTADCPLLDPRLIDQVVAAWRAAPETDYVATTLVRTFPRGLDVELVSAWALLDADAQASGYHRTHVTSSLYAGDRAYRTIGLVCSPPANDLRVTLDTADDLRALREVSRVLGDTPPAWRDVVATLRQRPDIVALNSAVDQKPIEAG
jgi:spore coat polysaccharide biosynthesis protein SpsF